MDQMIPVTRTEEWRPVHNFEGFYEVSNLGRVRSLPRTVVRRRNGPIDVPGGDLKVWLINGYPTVNLSANGVRRRQAVHILVCEAWHGPRPEGMFARHLDDVPTNNDPSNLAWGTPLDNSRDARRNGRNPFANRTHCPSGHAYTPENTATNARGHRSCRTCSREHHRNLRRSRKEMAR